jgi:two-component system chemotaxis response regulator CheY
VEVPINIRTLVVDDSRIMRNMIMETLRKTKPGEFTFTEAGKSKAMDKFDLGKIDTIFLS